MAKARRRTVASLLPKPPLQLGGRLALETGKRLFVKMPYHDNLLRTVEVRGRNPVSIWFLAGQVGAGKTWTLSWLGREVRGWQEVKHGDEKWEVALVPGLSMGAGPRTLVEAVFSGCEHLREHLAEEQEPFHLSSRGSDSRTLVKEAIGNEEVWAVLTGNRGRFPSVRGVGSPPKWTRTENQVDLLAQWFALLRTQGIRYVLVLIDEFEMVITALPPRQLRELSNALRRIYDILEDGRATPNVQFVLAATTDVVTQLYSTERGATASQGWISALRQRMDEPFYVELLTKDQALRIAEEAIGQARAEEVGMRFIPYQEEAVEYAYEVSAGVPRRFAGMLRQMYEDALLEGATEIGVQHAEQAADKLGYSIKE